MTSPMISIIIKGKRIPPIGVSGEIITFLNPWSYLILRNRRELLEQFDVIAIDGIALVIALNLIGVRAKRYSFDMTSLAKHTFAEAQSANKSVAIIGSENGCLMKAKEHILSRYSNLDIIESRHGYFRDEAERNSYIKHLANVNPNIVIVGMGAILQEEFLVSLRTAGWNGVGYTCGGFFHQTAKRLDYYPKLFDNLNLRWLYRIIDEPNLVRRYLLYAKFCSKFIIDFIEFLVHRSSAKNVS